ncbi:MAG TPA: hypothetical protein VFZ48_05280 [Candidatus Saccharimonadales bacterium]
MPKTSKRKKMLDRLLLEFGYFLWYKTDQVDSANKLAIGGYGRINTGLWNWFSSKFPTKHLGSRFIVDLNRTLALKYDDRDELARVNSEDMSEDYTFFFEENYDIKSEYVDVSNPYFELGNYLWHKINAISLKDDQLSLECAKICLQLIDTFDEGLPTKKCGYSFMIELHHWALLKQGGMREALQYGEIIKREHPGFFVEEAYDGDL